MMADSFITSPRFPVSVSLPLPLVIEDSMNKTSPPILVQARPVTTPSVLWSIDLTFDLPEPRMENKSSLLSFTSKLSSMAICLVLFLTNLAITLSKPRTPDSLVYSSTILRRICLLKPICSFLIPCSLICFGIRCLVAISTFSSKVYPLTSMISILSLSGP